MSIAIAPAGHGKGSDASMTEEQMRNCVSRLDERVFCVVEAAAPTPHVAHVVYEELGRQAQDVPRFSLVVDLRKTRVPNAATRHAFVEALQKLLPRIDHLALVMGGNNALRWVAGWVLQRAGCSSYSTHADLDEARMAAFASSLSPSEPLPQVSNVLPECAGDSSLLFNIEEQLVQLQPGLFEYREVESTSPHSVDALFTALRERMAPGQRIRLLVNLEGGRPIGAALRHQIQQEAMPLLAAGSQIAVAVHENTPLAWIAEWIGRRLQGSGRITVHETRQQALEKLLDGDH